MLLNSLSDFCLYFMSKPGGKKNVQLIWSHGLICNSLWGLCAEEWSSCFEDYHRSTPHTDIPHNNESTMRHRWLVISFTSAIINIMFLVWNISGSFPSSFSVTKKHSFLFFCLKKKCLAEKEYKIDVCQWGFKICQYLLHNLGFKNSDLKQRQYLCLSMSRGWLSFWAYFKKSFQRTDIIHNVDC